MNHHLYTPYCTVAPEHTKLSVVHTELRRYIKRSSARADYIVIATALRERLSMRGHPNWFLQQAFSSGPHYEDRQKILAGKSAAAIAAATKPVIVFATTYFRTLEQSGLSRAIFLNQPYLPGYLLREVNFLNAWRASRKLAALLICYDFSKSQTVYGLTPWYVVLCVAHTQQLKNCWSDPLWKSERKSTRCNFFMHAALVTQLAQNKPEAKQLTETHKSSLATLMMT